MKIKILACVSEKKAGPMIQFLKEHYVNEKLVIRPAETEFTNPFEEKLEHRLSAYRLPPKQKVEVLLYFEEDLKEDAPDVYKMLAVRSFSHILYDSDTFPLHDHKEKDLPGELEHRKDTFALWKCK